MDDQNRIENPLGFWVTSYRVDNDYAAAPPARGRLAQSALISMPSRRRRAMPSPAAPLQPSARLSPDGQRRQRPRPCNATDNRAREHSR